MVDRIHTVIVSDLHLTEAEPKSRKSPLWKRYKRRDLFIDESFARWLDRIVEQAEGPIELVLDGDIFDFDAVTSLPDSPDFGISWLERKRGLDPEESKSRYKMEVIARDHAVWFDALRRFLLRDNRLVFVIGNHDLELHWPAVRQAVCRALELADEQQDRVRFCEWFYVSAGDTLIEHGNQYDAYCVCADPIWPTIQKHGRLQLRLPFGDLASRLMLNGMGLFNPHVESSFVMSFSEYLAFFFKHLIRVQPLLLWTWFWSAMVTLLRSLGDGLHPSVKSPLVFPRRVDEMATRAGTSLSTMLALRQLHVHPATFNPLKIMRELWLDRALLVIGVLYLSFELVLFVNAFVHIPLAWTFVLLVVLMPVVVFYARSVRSDVYAVQKASFERIPTAAEIVGVHRVVHGHTHRELHTMVDGVEHLNTGTWSPAFRDPECTIPLGRKCFVWIRPDRETGSRRAELYAWSDPEWELLTGREEVGEVVWKGRPRTHRPPAVHAA